MDISGTHQFKASPQQVWDALHNGALLQSCVPGAQQIAWQGDSAITVHAGIVIGPLNATGIAQVRVAQQQPPSRVQLDATSDHVAATADISLAPQGAGTLLTYTAHADLNGPLAAVAAMAKPFVDGQLKHVFSCLDSKIG